MTDVTRQTLYRCWPNRAALLFDLILEDPDLGNHPEPDSDVRAVATVWLKSLRAGVGEPAVRTAVLAVTAQADHAPDSAQALVRTGRDRRAALNELLEPSGVRTGPRPVGHQEGAPSRTSTFPVSRE
ncbi:hypothetical protein ABZ876_32005 [Streptomyces sp. NPDC046931]|uniref:hypothetical protein n=1 Tax=Streptomyces sp. NPDC046931 TaxID=3154806 RepID=UPI003410B5E6